MKHAYMGILGMREKKKKEGKEKRKRKQEMRQFSFSLVLLQSIFDAISRVFPLTFPFSSRWSVNIIAE